MGAAVAYKKNNLTRRAQGLRWLPSPRWRRRAKGSNRSKESVQKITFYNNKEWCFADKNQVIEKSGSAQFVASLSSAHLLLPSAHQQQQTALAAAIMHIYTQHTNTILPYGWMGVCVFTYLSVNLISRQLKHHFPDDYSNYLWAALG